MVSYLTDRCCGHRTGRVAAGGLVLVLLVCVVIVMLMYFKRPEKGGKSYIETVVDSKKQAVAAVAFTELAGLHRELEMVAIVSDGSYPPLQELLETSQIAYKLLRRPGGDDERPCIYIEGQNQRMPPSNILVYDAGAAEAQLEGLVLLRDGRVQTFSAEDIEAAVTATRDGIQGR